MKSYKVKQTLPECHMLKGFSSLVIYPYFMQEGGGQYPSSLCCFCALDNRIFGTAGWQIWQYFRTKVDRSVYLSAKVVDELESTLR